MTNESLLAQILSDARWGVAFLILKLAVRLLPRRSSMREALVWGFRMQHDRDAYEAFTELCNLPCMGFREWASLWADRKGPGGAQCV